ncbi:restriction endonuclease [Clostridium botulinum]|nr:restriction endonuclease [Clostridium botulinum]NFO54784.1 restriction endonuclease [Clostridium botulinum]
MNEEMLKFADYIDELAETNPDYGLDCFFKLKDTLKDECKEIIRRSKEIDEIIPKVDRREKGKLSFEKGILLEKLAEKIFTVRNIFKEAERVECKSNEIDILLQSSTNNALYSRLLPDYFKKDILIECKNHKKPVDVTLVGKFYSLMRYKKGSFGIMVSNLPFTGQDEWDASIGLTKKLFLLDNSLILNITINDIEELLINNMNIVSFIERKVNHIKYHTEVIHSISEHPAEKIMTKPN